MRGPERGAPHIPHILCSIPVPAGLASAVVSLTPQPWPQLQVELEGSAAIACDPPPGRVVIVGPGHTFLQLAEAVDDAFARWDLAHLHAFELPDGGLSACPTPWRHDCRVLEETIDPLALFGERPLRPAIVSGWGWIPDQYGRTVPDQE